MKMNRENIKSAYSSFSIVMNVLVDIKSRNLLEKCSAKPLFVNNDFAIYKGRFGTVAEEDARVLSKLGLIIKDFTLRSFETWNWINQVGIQDNEIIPSLPENFSVLSKIESLRKCFRIPLRDIFESEERDIVQIPLSYLPTLFSVSIKFFDVSTKYHKGFENCFPEVVERPLLLEEIEKFSSQTYDNNIAKRIPELQNAWLEVNKRLEDIEQKEGRLATHSFSYEAIFKDIFILRIKDALLEDCYNNIKWLRKVLLGDTKSEELLGDMARIRERVRDVLGPEKQTKDHLFYMLFVNWILLYEANLSSIIDLEIKYSPIIQPLSVLQNISFDKIWEVVSKEKDLVLDVKQIKGIHNAFHASNEKRFVILSGLSGTGKTKILQKYAQAYCSLSQPPSSKNIQQVCLVPITPAFRDHTPLLGYLNPLVDPPRYIKGELTQFLLHAQENSDLPFFLILDEMNLARVEFYLAPILSAMESGTPVVFHDLENGEVPRQLTKWPSNIFIGGTVNMDETTHVFSDKVLDRAFTMEFWDIELESFLKMLSVEGILYDTITAVYKALQPAHLHFGYRTVKAIVDYVRMAEETDSDDTLLALDQAIFSKVLPKLRGQKSTILATALEELEKACANLSQCSGKLKQMKLRLTETGLTRFWR